MAFLLPNLSPTLLLQSKDRPVIHHTPLSPTIHTAILSPLTKLEPPLLRVAQVNQTPGSQDNQQRNDFYLNLGLSVRTLREDLPSLFTKDLNYDIYRYPFPSFHQSTPLGHFILFFYSLGSEKFRV
uniref:Uncharacterized protein n=1 Tax=Davidia involucrata TaxID=16924 RepID=A0A5B6ZIU0_DAVIN